MEPVPTSLSPCWVHTPPERVNTHTAPVLPLSTGPPTIAVFPSSESETDQPCPAPPITAPVPTSLSPCWVHAPPERVNTQAAPAPVKPSAGHPTIAVFPSPESETENPCHAPRPTTPVPTSLAPYWAHALPERVNTHTAPTPPLSTYLPKMAVFPSSESATEAPCDAGNGLFTAPVPINFASCPQTPPERMKTHAAPGEECRHLCSARNAEIARHRATKALAS